MAIESAATSSNDIDRNSLKPAAGYLSRSIPLLFGVFLLYCAITAIYCLADAHCLTREFIGDGGDNWVFVWNAWWVKQCILHFQNPYFCPYQFAPTGAPLTMHCLTLVPTLVMVALWQWVPMPLTYNLIVLSFFPFAGMGAFALARYITRDTVGAIVGGAAYMLCPFLTSKTLGHINLMGGAFLPLYVFCLLRAIDTPSRMNRAWLTLVFLLLVFTNEHTLIFAANATVWLWVFRSMRARAWKEETLRFWKTFKPIIIFSVIWGSFLGYYAIRYGAAPYRTGSLSFCPEPLGWIVPAFPTSIWSMHGFVPASLVTRLGNLEWSIYLGWLVLPLAITGYYFRRSEPLMKYMGLLFLLAMALAMGPKLQWNRQVVKIGGVTAYLPMGIYRYIPVLGAVGQSGRYMLIGYMAMSVATAGFIAVMRTRYRKSSGLAIAFAALVLIGLDYGFRLHFVPVPTCPIPPGPGYVMDAREAPSLSLYYQTFHGRPMLGGYLSRWPKGAFDVYEKLPGLRWFFIVPRKRGAPPSSEEVLAGLHSLNVKYVTTDNLGIPHDVLVNAKLPQIYQDGFGTTFEVSP